MTTPEPQVRFYDLSGPEPWSPACWCTRYALNYKGIPYTVTKLSYPDIRPTCERLFADMTGLHATVPIIEILGDKLQALNDSTPIARLLNEKFPASEGYRDLKGLDVMDDYQRKSVPCRKAILSWILADVHDCALDPHDGSKEYFKRTREERFKVPLSEVTEKVGGGEEAVLQQIREGWEPLRQRMMQEDGTGDPTYQDFFDASNVKWIEAASPEKGKKLMELYGDDTFVKLMKKVEKYT
ncbi:hypothetical protein BP6252_10023 [Coleophoma cylindrospora]|uniref:GST N-terminal domain-containing protein n=1 Tax=Coleophoma cylindrospora TaxID=1849047 RepID=A0A3D8QXI1_9HELO|nr:hypothetical protein BP6252_10023 [Coleophoma cylindrospora]